MWQPVSSNTCLINKPSYLLPLGAVTSIHVVTANVRNYNISLLAAIIHSKMKKKGEDKLNVKTWMVTAKPSVSLTHGSHPLK